MKKEQIQELFERFEEACYIFNDVECWSARELQIIFCYAKWDNFFKVIEKAKAACENSGAEVSYHFADIGKMIENVYSRVLAGGFGFLDGVFEVIPF